MIYFQDVTYTYPRADRPALQAVNLHIPPGCLALVTGPSGAGKSTFLRCINGLVPHFSGGHLCGCVQVGGLEPVRATPQVLSHLVGFVFQDPESQFVLDRVEDEIAFALENAAIPLPEMRRRVAQVLAFTNLESLRTRRLETLSGGERQRVAIAAALALQPQVLVLDEPTSQLDPHSAEEVLLTLARLKRDLKLTIVLAEHRLERVLHFSDMLIHIDARNATALAGPPRQILAQIDLNPPLVALGKALGWEPLPLTINEGREFAHRLPDRPVSGNLRPDSLDSAPPVSAREANQENVAAQDALLQENRAADPPPQTILRAEQIRVCYGNHIAVDNVSLTINSGEILALMGPNGAGKSSLLRCLIGLAKPDGGHIQLEGQETAGLEVADICRRVGYLPQDPNALLFAETVRQELQVTLDNHRQDGASSLAEDETALQALLERLGLGDKSARYPRDLSVGERQRVALGAVTVVHPKALLLDEPTRGLDYAAKRDLMQILRVWRSEGMAILLVTHDVELAAALADRVILLENGRIRSQGRPAEVLNGAEHFTPQIALLFPGSGWLTSRDVLQALDPVLT